jgi:hypothetical protein
MAVDTLAEPRQRRFKSAPHRTTDERTAVGRAVRGEVPRSSLGEFTPGVDRADPVDLLEEQAASRLSDLVPIRYGRMLVSPFTFFRGAAYLMAADLAGAPRTGLTVQLCGDAQLSNFGGFAAPDRQLVFGVNDFDETLPGPFQRAVSVATARRTPARACARPCRPRRRERRGPGRRTAAIVPGGEIG